MTAKKKNMTVKYVIEVISIILGLYIALFIEPSGLLTKEGLIVLGIFVWGIINLMLGLVGEYMVTMAMGALWFVSGAVSFDTAFSGFAGSTFWLIVATMGLGAAVKKSGLLKRLSLYSLKFFKPTYAGQLLSIVIMGIIIAPLIPSTSAKCAIMGALVLGISDELGLTKRGPGRFGLLMALWIGFNITGNVYVNASFQGYMVLGLLPEETQATYTWLTWLIRSLPWAIIVIAGMFLFTKFSYKEPNVKELSKEYIDDQFKAIGKLSRDEIITAIVMAFALIMFILESTTGISAVVVCILGMAALTFTKVIGKEEFVSNSLWPLVVFIGSTLGFSAVFSAVGIDVWLGSVLEPIAATLTNPYLFVAVICILTYVVRLFVAQTAANTLMVAIIYPLAVSLGMDPWIACVVIYGSSVIFYPLYTHSNILICYGACDGEENIDEKYFLKADVAYMVINLVAFLASVPIWSMLGMC